MARKRYNEDFKKQLVNTYNQGNHSYRSLGEEYDVADPTIKTWVIRYNKRFLFLNAITCLTNTNFSFIFLTSHLTVCMFPKFKNLVKFI